MSAAFVTLRRRLGAAGAVAQALLLAGCASFSPDGGMAGVNDLTRPALSQGAAVHTTPEDAAAASARVKALLAKPLTAPAVVKIALLNNRRLQAAYNALGLSEAALVQASLPPNPTFSLERIAGGGAVEIEGRIAANLLMLATLPARAAIAEDRFRQAQVEAAAETLKVASDARRAFFRAVAARAQVALLAQAEETGALAARLAKRLGETGAINKLDQARNRVFHAELVAQMASARQRAETERERLVRALGLWGDDIRFALPSRLPVLPARARALLDVEAEAVRRRLDLLAARIEVDRLAKAHGLSGATRFINLLEVAGITKTVREGGVSDRERGFEVELQVPLFDFGEVKVRQAELTYLQAVNRLTAKAVEVRSEARDAYQAYRATYDIARHYRRSVLPLRKIISDEMLLRYNAMQIDVFALLTEARQRIASATSALEAERDFWIAETNLGTAILGGTPPAADAAPISSAPTAEAPGH
jgi:outer membrane protein TolC